MLSVAGLVNVNVNLSPTAAVGRSFGTLMIAGDSPVISGLERYRTYASLAQVTTDFGVTTPEYLAASLYFSQTPKPGNLMIARWLRTATGAQNIGGLLTLSQQTLTAWQAITNGSFTISIDGTPQTPTGLNFSGATNLNGVASLITAGLTGATCTWNGTNFVITSNSTGAGVYATGTATFTGNPAVNDTITVNGVVITFVAGGATGNQVNIGATLVNTVANLQAFLAASANAALVGRTYTANGNVLGITASTIGTPGNAYTLAKTSTAITLSGATLAGGVNPSLVGYATTPGSGTDISGLLEFTVGTSQSLVPGYTAETPLQCVANLANLSSAWYGFMFAAGTMPTDDDNVAVAGFMEGQILTRVFGVTITNTNVLSNLVTTDLASRLKALGYNQTFYQYSTNPNAVASVFGRAFSVNFTGQNTTINLMFKQEPGVTAENISQNQALTLQNKNCNVFTTYDNNTTILQYGTMASGVFFDEIHGIDWLQNAMQTACYNVLYTTTTKVPQTDAGVNQLTNAIAGVCAQADSATGNGLIAPGTWNAGGFGQLAQGQFLKSGYYIYAQPIALQSQADRTTRIAPPIQVAVKLAGAIQSLNVMINVNR